MLTQRWGPLLILMFTTVFLNYVHGQCKIVPGGRKFPQPQEIYGIGGQYELRVEVNDIVKMKSMYVTEYFDVLEKKGRVDSHFDGVKKSFLYREKTKEGFIFGNGADCQSNTIENTTAPYEAFNVYDWKYVDHFGPFAMLLKGYNESKNMQYEGTKKVRGLTANVWKRCSEKNTLTIRYMLIDETQSGEIYGYGDLPIPLRITVEGTLDEKAINQSYEFIHFQIGFTDADTVLAIPFNKGCERLKESTKHMEYRDFNFVLEAEIVYTVHFQKDKHIYINNLKAAYDNTSQLFAYTTIPWIAHNDSKFALAGDELFRVYDVGNDYLYEVDLDKSSCNISATKPEESGAVLNLPNGDTFPLLDPNFIILNADSAAEFKHLGKGKVRGKEVDVFEKKMGDDKGDVKIWNITTRYYLSDGQEEKSETAEKNILLKVVYTEYMLGQPTTELVFNFYHYNSIVLHKPKTFDVSSCFREQNQTQWFQVMFPFYGTNLTEQDLKNAIPVIQQNFLSVLITDQIVTPVRVPRIMVDVDAYHMYLYITTALLERVPAKLDFKFEANVRLNDIANVVPQGLTTEEGCFQACIQNKNCKAINYCGVNCALMKEEYKSDMGTADEKCTLYKRVKESTQLTIEQVNKKMDERIGTQDFQLIVRDMHGVLQTLKYPTFRQGVAFGLNDFKGDGTNKKIDSSFTIFKSGYTIKTPDSSAKKTSAECQRECLSDPHCESLSFCDLTSSCGFSKAHGEDIDLGNLVQDDKCITLTRSYVSSFNQYPGVSMIRKAEVLLEYENPDSCAKACINEAKIQCRSFDLCSGGPGKTRCLLHSSHIIDSNGQDVQASNCEHYSRIYVLDFKVEKGKALTNSDRIHTRIENLPSVEECAKECVENPQCKTFDFCRQPFMKESQCYLSTTIPSQTEKRDEPSCSLYSKTYGKTENLLSPVKIETVEHAGVHYSEKLFADDDGQEKVEIIVDDTGYSKSLTGGIAFFLFLVGIAIGAAAMFGYGYYKANRRV